MTTPFKTLVHRDGPTGAGSRIGKRVLCPSGKGKLYDPTCTPFVLMSWVLNQGNFNADLTPFHGNGIAPPCSFWRLIETPNCVRHVGGNVNACGELVNLPFGVGVPAASYNIGILQLQIGCSTGVSGGIIWPGTCP